MTEPLPRMPASVFDLKTVSPLPKVTRGRHPANAVSFKIEPHIDGSLNLSWPAGIHNGHKTVRVSTPEELWEAAWRAWRDRPAMTETTAEAISRGVPVQRPKKRETKAEMIDRTLRELGLSPEIESNSD